MRAIILSAGLGTRLKPWTLTKAKPAINFLGAPLISSSFYIAHLMKVNEVICNLHHLPESVQNAVDKLKISKIKVHYKLEKQLLDSAGGIKNCEDFLSQSKNFLVLNGDSFWLFPDSSVLNQLEQDHRNNNNFATLLTAKVTERWDDSFRGVWVNQDGLVKHIGPLKNSSLPQEIKSQLYPQHYLGIQIINRSVFSKIQAGVALNIFYDVFNILLNENYKIETHQVDNWIPLETGNQKDYNDSVDFCEKTLIQNKDYSKVLNDLANYLNHQFSFEHLV